MEKTAVSIFANRTHKFILFVKCGDARALKIHKKLENLLRKTKNFQKSLSVFFLNPDVRTTLNNDEHVSLSVAYTLRPPARSVQALFSHTTGYRWNPRELHIGVGRSLL